MAEESQRKQGKYYIFIDHKLIWLNREQWLNWNQFRNQVRNDARRAKTCTQTNFRKCCGDCGLCAWKRNGVYIYLNLWHKDEYRYLFNKAALDPVADEVITKDLTQRILSYADSQYFKGGALLHMHLVEGRTFDEISRAMGISLEITKYRFKKLLVKIQSNKKIFSN